MMEENGLWVWPVSIVMVFLVMLGGIRRHKKCPNSPSGPDGGGGESNGDRQDPNASSTPAEPAMPNGASAADLKPATSLEAELERLRAENVALKSGGGLWLKVSDKGALSVYGMGYFPVTLYREQWERLLRTAPQIQSFISEHASELKVKRQHE